MKTDHTKPDFLCIGAQKSATTWLHKALNKHPEIWLPPVKELQHFNSIDSNNHPTVYRRRRRVQKLEGACRHALKAPKGKKIDAAKLRWVANYALAERCDDDWYTGLFQPGPSQICGEITPDYLTLSLERVRQIRSTRPNLKIIFIMREPIERALSGVKEKLGHNVKRLKGLTDADMIKMLDTPHNISRTDYRHTIETWEACYPKNQIQYLFFEDVRADPEEFLRGVFKFLGVSEDPARKLSRDTERANVSPAITITPTVRRHVAHKYRDLTYWLRDRFGGVTGRWVQNLEATISDG